MWTKENRGRHDRSQQTYPRDLTAEECAKWSTESSTGCQWRHLPKDLPSKSTVFRYFDLWNYDGTLLRLHHELYVLCREQAGRAASPTACIIDRKTREER